MTFNRVGEHLSLFPTPIKSARPCEERFGRAKGQAHSIMKASGMITIFSGRQDFQQRSFSFAASTALHIVLAAAIVSIFLNQPQLRLRSERYVVRNIRFQQAEPAPPPPPDQRSPYRAPNSAALLQAIHSGGPESAQAHRVPRLALGRQTLLQPKIPYPLKSKAEIPVPQTMIWTPEKTLTQSIVPDRPRPPAAADANPKPDLPNDETTVADLALSASPAPSLLAPAPAATTTPIQFKAPAATTAAPQQHSAAEAAPTPAAVLSLSDLKMEQGVAQLPPLNESVRAQTEGAPGAAPTGASDALAPQTGNGGAGTSQGDGSGQDASTANASSAPAADSTVLNREAAKPLETVSAAAGELKSSTRSERIVLPKNGRHGLVVVGSSMGEIYPEASSLWSGRLAYTVYLHVGAAKSWILQYAPTRASDAANAGEIARIDAPWPYEIVRPSIPSGQINADALMVHGFIDAEGRFEAIEVVFPPDFAQKQFILDSLAQWRFRPATQNGRRVRVETLLIIPDEP